MLEPIDELVALLQAGRLSRRDFVVNALRIGVSVPATAAFLAACGSSSSPTPTPSKKLSGTIQIFVGLYGTGNQPTQVPVQQTLAQAFMMKNPDVTINFLRQPSDASTKFNVLLSGGTPPDLVLPTGVFGTSKYLDQNVWLDLQPYFSRDGIQLSSFNPLLLPTLHATNYYGSNSKAIIGMPVGVNDHALAYNADLFTKAGVPEPPQSWSDDSWSLQGNFLTAAQALTLDKNGKHAGQPGFDPNNIAQFGAGHFFRETVFFAFGGNYYDASTRKALLDSSGSVSGIGYAADLINKYHAQPTTQQVAALGAGAPSGSEEQFAWRAGKLAMIDMCTCDIKSPYGSGVPFNWKTAPIPRGPARRFTFLNLDVGCIVAPSKNHDLAWEVLKYFAVDPANESQLSYGSYGEIPPLTANQNDFPKGIKQDLPSVNPQEWIDGFPSASTENEQWFPAFSQVNDLVSPAFDKITAGQVSADQGMAQLQQQAQAAIDQWFSTHKLPGGG